MNIKRRYIAVMAVFVPVVVITILKLYYPVSYQMLSGYMFAVALVFKTALLTFWSASKLKIITFLKGMTFIQGGILLIKRWFLDTIFARWLKQNITDHIKIGIKELVEYYRALNLKAKIKNMLIPLIVSILSAWALYATGHLNNLLLFTELKVIVIGISKTIVSMGTKLLGFMINSWITPILEVFALSYFLTWLEGTLGKNNPIVRLLNWIGDKLNSLIFFFVDINRKHIDPLLNDHVSKQSQGISNRILEYVKRRKISHEYEQFEKFEQRLLGAHIDAYHSFKDMEKIKDKKLLYALINRKTDYNLDIVAFVSRDNKGNLISEDIDNSFYHDIFILEGIASSHRYGIQEELAEDPDHSDFWVLNTSSYPALLKSHSKQIPTTHIEPNSIQLIKTNYPQNYSMGDIYVMHNGRSETVIPIEPYR